MTDYTITELNISKKGLTNLPDDINLYFKLTKLNCSNNKISTLSNLPLTLKELYCSANMLISLDNLPPCTGGAW